MLQLVTRGTDIMTPDHHVGQDLREADLTCRPLTTPVDGRMDRGTIPTTGMAAISRDHRRREDRVVIRRTLAVDTLLRDMGEAVPPVAMTLTATGTRGTGRPGTGMDQVVAVVLVDGPGIRVTIQVCDSVLMPSPERALSFPPPVTCHAHDKSLTSVSVGAPIS